MAAVMSRYMLRFPSATWTIAPVTTSVAFWTRRKMTPKW
jgi:hypothetical protein